MTLALLILLLVLSGVFSSMETSLATLNRARVKTLFNQTKLRIFSDWLLRPGSVLSVILIGNNFVNIAFSSILSYIVINESLERGFSTAAASAAALFITSIFLLLFGEIIPKNIATTYPQKVSSAFGTFLNLLAYALRPVTHITSYFSELLTGTASEASDLGVSRRDIGEISANLEEGESLSKIISRVLTLNQKKLEEVMTPREKIVGIDLYAPASSVEETIIDSGISRFPAYYGSLDRIAGIVYAREIVKARILEGKIDIKQYARRPLFIDGGVTVLGAYRKLVSKRVHIALVTDSSGKIAGIATMEDLLEEIFGNIMDEYDLMRSAPEK